MAFIDTKVLPTIERLPGWRGRYFNSPSMTFAHYEFDAGATIHEHSHPQEEVWQIIEGDVEITIDGVTQRSGPGSVGIVPPEPPHFFKAITSGRAIVVDYPLREKSFFRGSQVIKVRLQPDMLAAIRSPHRMLSAIPRCRS